MQSLLYLEIELVKQIIKKKNLSRSMQSLIYHIKVMLSQKLHLYTKVV